jgi:hypothetical protein
MLEWGNEFRKGERRVECVEATWQGEIWDRRRRKKGQQRYPWLSQQLVSNHVILGTDGAYGHLVCMIANQK